MESLQKLLESKPNDIQGKLDHIYKATLDESRYLDDGNFSVIHPNDLERLFDLYDDVFFEKQCRAVLADVPLYFRLSRRMTKTGGQTAYYAHQATGEQHYEITISSILLFQTFYEGDRTVLVNGLVCQDRLEALQRIFEHELVHLVEMLVWKKSSCGAERFQDIANRFFGHMAFKHDLITAGERAWTDFGIKPGERVKFNFEGVEYAGVVNRITKRATVLVEDSAGERYKDGRCYKKFYVPVGMLERA